MKVSIFCGTLGEIESTIVRTKKFKNLARHMMLGIIMTEAPTNEKEKLMKTLLREKKKDELVSFIDMKGTIDTSQASSFLNSPNEAKELLRELENEQYIENTYADYYHVTYEGHKRANETRKKGARWKL